VNGTGLVPVVAIAPLRWTIPEMARAAGADVPNGELVQPVCSVSGVQLLVSACGADVAACAVVLPRAHTGRVTATALTAQTASKRSVRVTARERWRPVDRVTAERLPPSACVNLSPAI
jgi:hypothetical protein